MSSEDLRRLRILEAELREMVAEVARLSGRPADDVIDTLGVGGTLEMIPLPTAEWAVNRLRPELGKLRRNNPPQVPGTNWRTLNYGEPGNFTPALAACYAIYLDGRLVYIGSSEKLHTRLPMHVRIPQFTGHLVTPWGRSARVTVKYRPCKKFGDWAMVELRLIRRLQPSGNVRGVARRSKAGA